MPNTPIASFRASAPLLVPSDPLGFLSDLPGTWVGTGFNLIARPHRGANPAFFLELNTTIETLEFTRIGGNVPNRGTFQDDINLFGVHYLQKVSDFANKGALHIEPGFWMNLPVTTDPPGTVPTVIRQSAIPHGDTLLAQSSFVGASPTGLPVIDPVSSLPFTDATIPGLNSPAKSPVAANSAYAAQYAKGVLDRSGLPPLPAGTTDADVILNPALVLKAAITGQKISATTVLAISTAQVADSTGILNIPFVTRNANARQLDAIFWIETVDVPGAAPFLQLQYVQRVILDFPDLAVGPDPVLHWPHISVATLVKQ